MGVGLGGGKKGEAIGVVETTKRVWGVETRRHVRLRRGICHPRVDGFAFAERGGYRGKCLLS